MAYSFILIMYSVDINQLTGIIMMNMLITHQDRIDAADAKTLGIGLSEYKDAKCKIDFSNRTISKEEILRMVREMHTTRRVCAN